MFKITSLMVYNKTMSNITVIAHNLRSTYNVGSLLRTMDGLGLTTIYFTGTTPYPMVENDSRLAHIAKKNDQQIHKTALGAERNIDYTHHDHPLDLIQDLKNQGFMVAALEQSTNSVSLTDWVVPDKLALILGNELNGVDQIILDQVDQIIEIPMKGKKESFNVSVAAAISLFFLSYRQG